MNGKSFRWGILGPGRIAHKFAHSLPFSKNGRLTSVASTDLKRAKRFAEDYSAEHAFGSYSDLIRSGTVDAIYVATPHNFHKENTAECLRVGIPVLCEKPLTENPEDSLFLTDLSKATNTFLLEGMWTVFLPHFLQMMEWIRAGHIGDVVHVQADFGYKAEYDLGNRLFNPALGGSVTKDVGIYPLSLFYKILGAPSAIQSMGRKAVTGVDDHVVFQGKNQNDATFQGMVSFLAESDVEACIVGTKGKIKINSQWLRPVGATLITEDAVRSFKEEIPGFGFQFEADEVERCVVEGKIESDVWSHRDSLTVANLISQVEKV
jgi:predicted dehydrogenase